MLLNKLLAKVGLKVSRVISQKFYLQDVFRSSAPKRVLISYLTHPFVHGVNKTHTSFLECYTAAEIFGELGYAVDVVAFDYSGPIDYSLYDAVYGFGVPLEKAFYAGNNAEIKKIFYSPGTNPFIAYQQSSKRVLDFYERTGKLVPQSSRIMHHFWTFQYTMPDLCISLGNHYILEGYRTISPRINAVPLNAFYFDIYDIDLGAKDFSEARKHYLWFGSSGLLHKGLDFVIEYFASHPDLFLHICGASHGEREFFDYYQPIIDRCSNIIDHGFIQIDSAQFISIMDSCAFVVFFSASEGGSPALLNVMANGGLIPLVNKAVGVDVADFGFVIDELEWFDCHKIIDSSILLDETELKDLSLKAKNTVRREYRYDAYKMRLKYYVESALT